MRTTPQIPDIPTRTPTDTDADTDTDFEHLRARANSGAVTATYTGQVFRQILIGDMKSHLGMTSRLNDGSWFPTLATPEANSSSTSTSTEVLLGPSTFT